nr:hypothetical protein [Lactiplantibacillus plantarum]
MKDLATGTSHAKIILIGEHGVVYGQPAIALPISTIQMQAIIHRRDAAQTVKSRYFNGDFKMMSANLGGIQTLIRTLLARFDAPSRASIFTSRATFLLNAEWGPQPQRPWP